MREIRITCDKCGLSIQPLDTAFDDHRMAGGGSLVILQRVTGGMGHNQVPIDGWHFHMLCFSEVVEVIVSVLRGTGRTL